MIDYENLPQLIVALDSTDDTANYVHINDVKEDMVYYCPCCKGVVKPRAYKQDKDYQVQPHFYHESGGCSEETYVHYICKNWLFVKGCKFVVNGVEYEVKDAEPEVTLHTDFGDYIPDILVTTTTDKIFYFEIRNTNKKTELYIPKWDALGNDVVEVDVRKFVNQKYVNQIPVFDLIYSEGECFIKTYTHKEYDDVIAKRKMEWKRQDKINYKIQWERLDWFWNTLQDYYCMKAGANDVVEIFSRLEFEDMEMCLNVIHKHKPTDKLLEEKCIEINNSIFDEKIKELGIKLSKISPRVFCIKEKIIENISREITINTSWTPHIKGIRFLQLILDKLLDNNIKNRIIYNINNVEEKYKKYLKDMTINNGIIHFLLPAYPYLSCRLYFLKIFDLTSDYQFNNVFIKYEEDCKKAEKEKIEEEKRKKQFYEEEKRKILLNNEIVEKQRKLYEPEIQGVVEKINNCSNHAWKCEYQWVDVASSLLGYWKYKKEVQITITFIDGGHSRLIFTFDNLKHEALILELTKSMNSILKYNGLVTCRRKRRFCVDSALSRVLFVRGGE